MNKLEHKICLMCNERFPSINLILGMCRYCYGDKNEIKKFSHANNMDPGDVPEELKDLTEIEEMLIAQTFPIISVYYLCRGQYAYSGNVINFPQDIGEFVSHLPQYPSTLDTLIKSTLLADQYYADIIIDDNVLRMLPDEGSIDDLLPQIRDAENRIHHVNYKLRDANRLDSETDNTIIRNFIPAPFPLCSENHVIDDALAHMQSEPGPVIWPNINDTAINKFNTPGYIARTFPTLYLTGSANLQAEHIRDVKPAEYFQHLLKYKDRRFAHHPRWRYFALNSQMCWHALHGDWKTIGIGMNGNTEDFVTF
ncbi:hypothetical protein RhiirC2_793548 [Rhizophagus irregularis]|uniref:DUF6570 domain-containing protein n=1 Tax=Rhizophagus irregularis TaxID=588596 RepID=A0A2N1MF69_9GLOM|nr:hypothetical protein RhiirC2_793548 [Rhizophagus irregularis]